MLRGEESQEDSEPEGVTVDFVESSESELNLRSIFTVLILFAVNLLNYMDRLSVAGVLDDIKSYFGVKHDSLMGLLQTVFICSFMIFAPVFGYLGDRFSRKKIIICGVTVWSVTVLLSTFVRRNHFGLFMFCRCVVGIGEASYTTIAPTLIADLFSHDLRSRMLMLFYIAIPTGSGLGFIVSTNVEKAFKGQWQWGLRVTPPFGILCCIAIAFVLKEPARGAADHSVTLDRTSYITDLRLILKNKSYVWSTIGFTCVAFVTGALTWWAIAFIGYAQKLTSIDVDEAKIGLDFGIITAIAGLTGVICGSLWAQIWRVKNKHADPLVCGFGLLAGAPFLMFSLIFVQYSINGTWAILFIAVTCLSLNWAITSDMLLYLIVPSRRATAAAMQILVSHLLGDAASPYIIGQVSDALRRGSSSSEDMFTSLQRAMFMGPFVCVLGAFFYLGTAWYIEADHHLADEILHGAPQNSEDVFNENIPHERSPLIGSDAIFA